MTKKFFTKTNCKRQIKKSLKLEQNKINYWLIEKVIRVHLMVELIKKILLYKMSYFPKPYTHS